MNKNRDGFVRNFNKVLTVNNEHSPKISRINYTHFFDNIPDGLEGQTRKILAPHINDKHIRLYNPMHKTILDNKIKQSIKSTIIIDNLILS